MTKRLTGFFTNRASLLIVAIPMLYLSLSVGVVVNRAKAAPVARDVSLPVYTYYTDATLTVVCGHHDVCAADSWGCVTPYKTSYRKNCPNPLR